MGASRFARFDDGLDPSGSRIARFNDDPIQTFPVSRGSATVSIQASTVSRRSMSHVIHEGRPLRKSLTLFDSALIGPAIAESFRKLSPRVQLRNPVMFVVYVGALLTSVLLLQALRGHGEAPSGFILSISLWLWFTVLFANFAEALAEGRSKAQAASLRGMKQSISAKKLQAPQHGSPWVATPATQLRKGDVFLVEAGDSIPADGEVIDGVASVDESAITGESAPVVRESGGDFCAVTGGTRVLSDWLVVRVGGEPGGGFHRPHDRHGRRCQAAENAE